MKFRRERTPSHWLVEDIYLRETWGQTYGLSRPRRWNPRRLFVQAMIVFAVVDVLLALFFVGAYWLQPRTSSSARNPAANGEPTFAALQPTSGKIAVPVATATPNRRRPTPTRVPPTRRPTQARTAIPPTAVPTAVPQRILAPAKTVPIQMPASLGVGALAVPIPAEPADCMPADQMPPVVNTSVKLCAGQSYHPFTLQGNNIGVFGDPAAVIRTEGRKFGITAEGSNILIQKVVIRGTTDAGDAAKYLCLYPDCGGAAGGAAYGGGILVHAPQTTVMDSDIAGGVVGVAAEHVQGLKLINNRLDNSTGWGSYNFAVDQSNFVGNSWSNDNRSCTTPDGVFLSSGCESAGWVCIACQKNVIALNTCTDSGNCFYINGEGNLTSNYNRFHQNQCRASPHNCFEVTFSVGNEFVENVAQGDPTTGATCKYPFWVGGSQVIFARNTWSCAISPLAALQEATASTTVLTNVENR